MCEHLKELEDELKAKGIKETFRGEAWSSNCREWVYYDCYLDCNSIRNRLKLPDFVEHSFNDDPRSGLEEGFFCKVCLDAVMGYHTLLDKGKNAPVVH